MIIIALQNKTLAKKLKSDLGKDSLDSVVLDTGDSGFMANFYRPDITAIVSSESFAAVPIEITRDLLNSIAGRLPVLVVREHGQKQLAKSVTSPELSDAMTVLDEDRYSDILSTISLFSGLRSSQGVKTLCRAIPFYNAQIPISMLNTFGGLGILTIDASSFNKISVEYGSDVYSKMKAVFHDILFDLWGKLGSFRESDVICRKSMNSNTYVIFMNRSRDSGALPHPGVLEQVADRISKSIHNSLWDALFAPKKDKIIPECVESIPLVGVGFFGVLNNPCLDVQEILDSGLDASKQMAVSQHKRERERQRELMQTLIQSNDLLTPHYQGVFNLQAVTKELVDEVRSSNSIVPLKDHIFGFESLIRVNQKKVQEQENFNGGAESRYLRPDVLFSLAKYTKVALELDQACMKHAARAAVDLPGTLMINILPRNLYYIDRLKSSFKRTERLMFEISESEAISNFDLMMKSRDHLEKNSMGIAADDFGKGYSSLERIIKIKPHVIKFDRGMIQDIDNDPVKQAYVKGLVKAAKILNTTILAEGVETWEEAMVLKAMGVELIQGFLLHRPQEVQTILDQIKGPKLAKKGKLNTVA